ncbi:D-2-hydroxyglutarate dehydrogenase, mitochondrial [Umbelopsis sp. WA50703]
MEKHGFALTPLTADKLTRLQRDPQYKKIEQSDIDYFRSVLPESNVLETSKCSEETILGYVSDWYNLYRGSSSVVLLPRNTEQVQSILKYCNDQHIAVVPQSGNTSASGGSVPVFDEIVVSTKMMEEIRSFDPLSGALVCDAGCNLEKLDKYLADYGYQIPLDLPAKHLCRIGGNASTNAGGIRQMRFGNLHGSIMGLEVVLPDGTVLDNLSTMKKDNTGYHLKNLFIGSEGTLGYITAVSIQAARIRPAVNVLMLAFPSYEHVVQAYDYCKKRLSETISAFEVLDQDSIRCVQNVDFQIPKGSAFPIGDHHNFYVVMETAGSIEEDETKRVNAFLQELLEQDIASDGAIASTPEKRESFWSWRTKLPPAIVQTGPHSIHFDISMPIPKLYQVVYDTRAWMDKQGIIGRDVKAVYGYGHVGDGNLHLTIPALIDSESLREEIDEFIYTWLTQYSGSVSAEHGIGLMKAPYLTYTKSVTMVQQMQRIKNMFDPNGILNPYKLFPKDNELWEGQAVRKRVRAANCGC